MALNEGQIVTLAVDEIIDTISAITPMVSVNRPPYVAIRQELVT